MSSNIRLVNADEMETLEHYGASLLTSMLSLKTLERYQLIAFKKGILSDDEKECSKTICWEIQRLLGLYKSQMNYVLERTGLDEQQIIDGLKSTFPDVKIPRKKKETKKKEVET